MSVDRQLSKPGQTNGTSGDDIMNYLYLAALIWNSRLGGAYSFSQEFGASDHLRGQKFLNLGLQKAERLLDNS